MTGLRPGLDGKRTDRQLEDERRGGVAEAEIVAVVVVGDDHGVEGDEEEEEKPW